MFSNSNSIFFIKDFFNNWMFNFLYDISEFQTYFRSLFLLMNEENGALKQWKLVKYEYFKMGIVFKIAIFCNKAKKWIALQVWIMKIVLTLTRCATSIWITFKSFNTRAYWLMILNVASCVKSTWADARILTLLSNTSTTRWTFLMNYTFRSTIWWCS